MALDERLQQLADAVPAPPPGDAAGTFARGVRRRRLRRGVNATVAIAAIAVVGIGVASLVDGAGLFEIVDEPSTSTPPTDGGEDGERPGDWPVVAGVPALSVTTDGWLVAVAPGGDGRWCVSALQRASEAPDATGERCDQLLTPQQLGDPDRFGTGGSEAQTTDAGELVDGVSWGFAPQGADEVHVLFDDGTRRQATLAAGGSVEAPLWAIGYRDREPLAIEAHVAGDVIAGRILATTTLDGATAPTPGQAFGDRLLSEDIDGFTDEQQQLLDLQTGDELYRLPIDGTDRSVGIRARDGLAPLLFATSCDVLTQVELPERWIGICLEHTDPDRERVRGLFPHGTTSTS